MNGRVIGGRYELATVIGQGGMGQVWTAYDRRLDRRVAVKLLRPATLTGPSTAADELRRRFVRECRVTAHVDHPGLVTVHDAGSEGEDLYLVMQYVEGADLADHLAEHDPYPWEWAVSVAAQLCAVLAAVHAVPIVHRDLKPRNVMVRPDGSVLVLDLGVASVLDSDTTRLTHTGSPIGSPAYMAPEQAMGGAVGPSTDLYALGVLLHELLSGNVPFAGSTALGVLHRHLYESPVALRRLRPEVPEPLEALVLRLLAKDPRERPSGAHEVYEELLPLLPARGAPAGPMDPTRPFLRPYAPWPDRPTESAVPPGAAGPAHGVPGLRRAVRVPLHLPLSVRPVGRRGRGRNHDHDRGRLVVPDVDHQEVAGHDRHLDEQHDHARGVHPRTGEALLQRHHAPDVQHQLGPEERPVPSGAAHDRDPEHGDPREEAERQDHQDRDEDPDGDRGRRRAGGPRRRRGRGHLTVHTTLPQDA
ncbi:serine/threonine-protein kinase [Streptomyces sp. NPDC001919]